MVGALARGSRFWNVLLATAVSAGGDAMLYTALVLTVFLRSQSLLGLGTVFIAQAAPRVVLGPWVGTLVDRWPARRVLVVAD